MFATPKDVDETHFLADSIDDDAYLIVIGMVQNVIQFLHQVGFTQLSPGSNHSGSVVSLFKPDARSDDDQISWFQVLRLGFQYL